MVKDNRKLGGGKIPQGMVEEVTEGLNFAVIFTILGLALFWALLMIIIL